VMPSVREEIRSILRALDQAVVPDPYVADWYRKMAIVEYYRALRLAPYRDADINRRYLETAYGMAEKAILLGLAEDKIDVPFSNLRRHWLPRLQA